MKLTGLGYCGNSFGAGSVAAPASDCSFPCAGNSTQKCGAGNRLSVWAISGTTPPKTTSAAATSTSKAATATGFPTGWTAQGCWVDNANGGRILKNQQPDNAAQTLQTCVNTCAAAGYTIAGAEYAQECFCDNFIYNGGAKATNQADCNTPCPGNSAQSCGAGNRLTIYSKGTPQTGTGAGGGGGGTAPPGGPTIQKTGLPAGWAYSGCLQ
jgi:hypothetical protein